MNRLAVATITLLTLALGACESLPIHGRRSVTSMAVDPTATAGTLFIWSNDVNAGIVNQDNQICMQRAMTARGGSASAEAKIPAAILNLSEVAVAASKTSEADTAASLSTAIAQSVTSLSTTSERTAFLDIGMFYLCQLAANKAIDPATTVVLTERLFIAAAGMSPAGSVPQVDAPPIRPAGGN